MPDAPSPREVFLRLIDGVSTRRGAEVADLYAEDAVVTHPFALPHPTRHVGREALRAHFEAGARVDRDMRPRNVIVHETADPEVIVAEFEYHGTVPPGRTFTFPCIFVLRVRDGLIVESRDYANHVPSLQVAGRLEDVIAQMTSEAPES